MHLDQWIDEHRVPTRLAVWLAALAVLSFLGFVLPAQAATVEVEWQWPTLRTDGAPLPASEIREIAIAHGTCNATNTGLTAATGTVTAAPPTTVLQFERPAGPACVQAHIVDTAGLESARVVVPFTAVDQSPPTLLSKRAMCPPAGPTNTNEARSSRRPSLHSSVAIAPRVAPSFAALSQPRLSRPSGSSRPPESDPDQPREVPGSVKEGGVPAPPFESIRTESEPPDVPITVSTSVTARLPPLRVVTMSPVPVVPMTVSMLLTTRLPVASIDSESVPEEPSTVSMAEIFSPPLAPSSDTMSVPPEPTIVSNAETA